MKSYTRTLEKGALLLGCFITASLNAITANIPQMAETFSNAPLYLVELVVTIPSLFSMVALFLVHRIAAKTSYKLTALLGILICAISGVLPYFVQTLNVILMARGLFGVGSGFLGASIISTIIITYTGEERSTMIGLQGAAGGLGSLGATYMARELMGHGWPASFLTYGLAFPILIVYFLFAPKAYVQKQEDDTHASRALTSQDYKQLIMYGSLAFFGMLFSNLFIIKVPSLITTTNLGGSQDASSAIMLISLGSLMSGIMYGKIASTLKKNTLPFAYLLVAISFFIAAIAPSFIMLLVAAFIFGYAFMVFIPYIQDISSLDFPNHTGLITSTIFLTQGVGGFVSPYMGNIITSFTPLTSHQYMVGGVIFLIFVLVSPFVSRKK